MRQKKRITFLGGRSQVGCFLPEKDFQKSALPLKSERWLQLSLRTCGHLGLCLAHTKPHAASPVLLLKSTQFISKHFEAKMKKIAAAIPRINCARTIVLEPNTFVPPKSKWLKHKEKISGDNSTSLGHKYTNNCLESFLCNVPFLARRGRHVLFFSPAKSSARETQAEVRRVD